MLYTPTAASAHTANEADIRAFVMKPLARKELAETVRSVLDAKRE